MGALGRGEQPPDILTVFCFAETFMIVSGGGQMMLLSGNGGNETSFSILMQIVQQIQDKEER